MDASEITEFKIERRNVTVGRHKYRKESSRIASKEGGASLPHYVPLMRPVLTKAALGVRKYQTEARKRCTKAQIQGLRLANWEVPITLLDPRIVAAIAVRNLFLHGRDDKRIQSTAYAIGRAMNVEIAWQEARKAEAVAAKERGYNPPNRCEMMKKRIKNLNIKNVSKWLKRVDDIKDGNWSKSECFEVGSAVIKAVLPMCPDVFFEEVFISKTIGGFRKTKRIRVNEAFITRMNSRENYLGMLNPTMSPMVAKPLALRKEGDRWVGGYLSSSDQEVDRLFVELYGEGEGKDQYKRAMKMAYKYKPVKRDRYLHDLRRGEVTEQMVVAINSLQQTAWKVNQPVLNVAVEALSNGLENAKGPLPVERLLSMPEAVDATRWAQMSKEERGTVASQREAVHSHNNRQTSRAMSIFRAMDCAKRFKDTPALYFPHDVDWRGRAYPVPQDLHPQADDFTKSFLTFAEERPLGEHGGKWLVFHLANCYGMDKGSREDQAEWFNAHRDDIYDVASDPFGKGLEFWSQAEEPWQFLAAAIEVCRTGLDPEAMSSLPVHIDGSCNGLQHLSAMGLDPTGAKAVNLTPGPRQDIYQIVADKVNLAIEDDIRDLEERGSAGEAHNWSGRVSRKTVKRGVMTTPYGLTPIGMRDQLIKDRWTADLEGDQMANANYLRDKMQDAISDTIIKGTEIMQWFQDCAEILAEQDKGIYWYTPTGYRVYQHYTINGSDRVNTLMGRMHFERDPSEGDRMNKKKQVLSIAPNIIHSFDAAHMMKTVMDTSSHELSYSMVHDSFGTHAGDMELLAHRARVVFADMYSHNWFMEMYEDFKEQCDKGYVIPEPPVLGDFDIWQVVHAEYFFA